MIKEQEFDYYAYTQAYAPEAQDIRRGCEARRQRFDAAQHKTLIRIDGDILEQFRQLLPDSQDDEQVINQALREWLAAQNVKELVREELQQMLQAAVHSMSPSLKRRKVAR